MGQSLTSKALFCVGQVVHHVRFDYRGVIVDVDAGFEGSEEWYEHVARSRPPREKPWYHVLVDGGDQMTYVAERNLEADTSREPIQHPELDDFFVAFREGSYQSRHTIN